ncbi:MAG: hypothetical protein WBO16_06990 [Gammaproteobacteria bacterium]|jgi:hypothetical protein
MVDIIVAIGFITALMAGWIAVQHLARSYAARHPEFGPAREEGSGCGKSCLCTGGSCARQEVHDATHSNDNERNTNIT